MELTLFTPLPPCTVLITNKSIMDFCDKRMITVEEQTICNSFYNEMTLDGRINSLRETDEFKYFVPEEASHTICLWLRDDFNCFFSPGTMIIDDSYLIANGADTLLKQFKQSFNNEGTTSFEYVYSSTDDSTQFGDFLLLLRSTLEMQCYNPAQKTSFDSNVINVVDKRLL